MTVRLVTYGPVGQEQPGVLLADMILPLAGHLRARGIWAGDSTTILGMLPVVEQIVESADDGRELIPVGDVRLGPPVLRPSKIVEVGFNTWSLLRTSNTVPFTAPALYAKAPSAVTGPYDPIARPLETKKLDYEIELAVVIGRRCRAVSQDEAPDYIAGFTVANDVTARDMQFGEGEGGRYHRQNYHSKSFDTFCPLGPCLVTGQDAPAPGEVSIRTYVNGDLRQEGSTAELVWPVPALIAFISAGMTLEVGDVILTGSPAGSGYLMDPQVFLSAGDVVTGVVEGVGQIENVVRDEDTAS